MEKDTKSRWLALFGIVIILPETGLWLPHQHQTISIEDWKIYLEIADAIDPVLNEDAEQIIRQYFLLNRSHRPTSEFQSKSLSILLIQSKGIAKLNLRNEVTRCDALLAVMLYEQQLQQMFPNSMSPIVFKLRDLSHIIDNEEETTMMASDDKQNYQKMSSLLDVS